MVRLVQETPEEGALLVRQIRPKVWSVPPEEPASSQARRRGKVLEQLQRIPRSPREVQPPHSTFPATPALEAAAAQGKEWAKHA